MSTRSHIALKAVNTNFKNRYIVIYCHHDGYINGVGKELLEKYDTYEKAYQLIMQGHCSYLGAPYEREDNACYEVVYGDLSNVIEDYLYVFENGEWFVSDKSGKYNHVSLKSCFNESEIINTRLEISNKKDGVSKVLVDKDFLCELQGFLQGLYAVNQSNVYEHYIKKIETYCE